MSERAVLWARKQNLSNVKARKMLMIMAGAAGDDGIARVSMGMFLGADGIDTQAQFTRVLNVLKDQGIVSTYFDFDTRTNVYQLKLPSHRQEGE